MSALLPVLLLVVFFACLAMMIGEGLWSNAIMFFNVMTAALLATNYFEPLASWLERKDPTYTYVLDFLALWTVFCGVLILLRLATDKVSRVKVRFKRPVEWGGGILFALWVGWIMVCFTTFTLHTAPLAHSFLGGAFQPEPRKRNVFRFRAGPEMARFRAYDVDRRIVGPRARRGRVGGFACVRSAGRFHFALWRAVRCLRKSGRYPRAIEIALPFMSLPEHPEPSLVEYRPFCGWAIAALLIGLGSASAAIHPLLWMVPLAGIGVAAFALLRIRRTASPMVGRTVHCWVSHFRSCLARLRLRTC